ncbi:SNF2 family N-terminal domain-containing protein [Scheffersomyces xylosifermentans]|uniref:SNF2 family N-terminal domain-containing protein n=1 Tax=Scheffersomyces xylosifermentans TaxID=1304137 RepID=UPI00315D5F77
MTTTQVTPTESDSSDEELELKRLIESEEKKNATVNSEQEEFNHLSRDHKLGRLNNLIQKSQIYSQIIADNILQATLNKKNAKPQQQPTPEETPTKKRRVTRAVKPKSKHDITSMLSTKIKASTKSTMDAIDKSQKSTEIQQPKLVTGGVLKDYQLDGLQWLVTLYENGLNGILADEMGLGKTLQCISFLSFLIENGISGPFLIVVPLSTLSNWYNEIQRFAPKINVFRYTGSKIERNKLNLSQIIAKHKTNIVITSYEISIKDFIKLNAINWNYLIVDEGHRLKNSECILIKFLKKLNVSNRLLLTGTPLQNNLNELWSLLNFILPDIFHDLELFQQWFNFDELTNFADSKVQDEDEETKQLIKLNIQENLIKNLHTILKPFLLRRLKRDVIKDLPPKKEYLIHIPLTKLQKKLYYDALDNKLYSSLVEVNLKEFIHYNHHDLFSSKSDYSKIDKFLVEKFDNTAPKAKVAARHIYTEAESEDEFEIEEVESPKSSSPEAEDYFAVVEKISTRRLSKSTKQQLLLNALYHKIRGEIRNLSLQNLMIQLRNICNSPYIYYEPFVIDENNAHEGKFSEILVQNSAKMHVLQQLCAPLIRAHHKILIFSQFTKLLDLLHDWFNYNGTKICRLDGSTNQSVRDQQITQFNEDSDTKVFLLSTRAGGLGINLTAADTVILFDNDWNPQMDLQAIDRVHRIGQLKPVKIYRFLIRDSIEELLISKSCSKRFLETLVIQMGEFKFNKLESIIKDDKNATELNVKQMIELSKIVFKSDEFQEESNAMNESGHSYDFDSNTSEFEELLTAEEMSELLDRRLECYGAHEDKKFKNISVFETVNNLDK